MSSINGLGGIPSTYSYAEAPALQTASTTTFATGPVGSASVSRPFTPDKEPTKLKGFFGRIGNYFKNLGLALIGKNGNTHKDRLAEFKASLPDRSDEDVPGYTFSNEPDPTISNWNGFETSQVPPPDLNGYDNSPEGQQTEQASSLTAKFNVNGELPAEQFKKLIDELGINGKDAIGANPVNSEELVASLRNPAETIYGENVLKDGGLF